MIPVKMTKLKCWKKQEIGVDGRIIRQTKDRSNAVVVNPMAYGKGKWHVGYNNISNVNHVDLANNISKKKALVLANKYMKSHDKC